MAMASTLATESADHSVSSQEPKRLPLAEAANRASAQLAVEIDEAEQRRAECAKRQHERWEAVVKVVGERYGQLRLRTWTPKTPAQHRVYDSVCEYAGDMPQRVADGQGLVLHGPVGTGKDHLAIGVLAKAVGADLTVGAVNGQDWYGRLRDAIDARDSESAEIGKLVHPQVLLVSDPLPPIGSLTQHQATMLYRLIDDRCTHGLVTIVTVNIACDAEADRAFGTATWDRICDNAWKVACCWESHRKPARVVS